MRTITDQLNMLPPDVKKRAFAYKKDWWDNEKDIPSVKLALAVAFKWGDTDEGQLFWSEVYRMVS
jgi:hypothetical protein